MKKNVDFSAIATSYGVKCSDGLTIKHGSFSHQNGMEVPIVFQHNHNDLNNVVGHGVLYEEPNGMRINGYLNQDVSAGRTAKALLQHGDIKAVSIYANGLKKDASRSTVIHGNIKEVSLVLSPANPGAVIDYVALEHSDGSIDIAEDEAVIYNGQNVSVIEHADKKEDEKKIKEDKKEIKEDEKEIKEDEKEIKEDEKEIKEDKKEIKENDLEKIFNELDDSEILLIKMFISILEGDVKVKDIPEKDMKQMKEIYDNLPSEKKGLVNAIVGKVSESKDSTKQSELYNNYNEGGNEMGQISHNIFNNGDSISHAELKEMEKEIFQDAIRNGSLKEAVIQHAATYGVDHIDYLFPEAQLAADPSTIKRNDEWVGKLMNGVNKRPFARIKSIAFDITTPEARAKGYVKSNRKVEEVISALKRVTPPQTIYKKQKLDRDDILDITDFDIVAYLRSEMKEMLQEEIARAVIIGDGRLPDDTDKISEDNIRPIVSDDSTYTIRTNVEFDEEHATNKEITDVIIEQALRARKDYKGSGNPVMFCSNKYLTTMLLAQDSMGRKIYNNDKDLASSLRVSEIIECPVMENATYTDKSSNVYDIVGVIFNMKDYTIGADKKGEMAMFDDFDIDYNANKYLLETRCSGALIKPYSAIVLLKPRTNAEG